MSDFLERCRELANNKPVTKCRTVHTSPAYTKLLGHAERLETKVANLETQEAYLLSRLRLADDINERLCMGMNRAEQIIELRNRDK